MTFKTLASVCGALCLSFIGVSSMAEDGRGAGFGSPNATENTIEDDARITQPWFDWKKRLQEKRGFSFGLDYSALTLSSSEIGTSGDDNAAGGIARFFGSWDLLGRDTKNTGALVWKVEHRHSYTDVAPQGLGFDQGYVGLIEPPFSDEGGRWTNLYWRQRLNQGRATITAGLLDATDYVNVYALASPWTGFMNFAFSTGSASIFIPNDAAFGIAGGAMLTDQMFVIGGIVNAFTDSTDPFDTVGDFFSENEYFSSIEVGFTRSQERIFLDNMHITLWHVDESLPAGTPGGWGVAFNYSRALSDNTLMPFVRGGYADEGGTLLQKSLSVGLGYNTFGGRDQLGAAFNWGQPNEDSFGEGLDDQLVFETYYRWQLTEQFAITPAIQYLRDPALNPEHNSLWIFGLRGRLAL